MSDGDRQPVYLFEGFRLDARRRVLFGTDGQPIPLTSRLFDTLLYLVERPGQLVTKEQLLEAIWPHAVVEEQSLGKTELYCVDPPLDDGRYPLVARDLEGRLGRTIGFLTEEQIPGATLMPPALRFSPTHDGSGLTYSVRAGDRNRLGLEEGLADIRLP